MRDLSRGGGEMAKRKTYLDKLTQEIKRDILTQAKNDFKKCAARVNNEMHKEVIDLYDTLIEQFYKYHTTSYVRHWEGVPGTEQGQNLYFGIGKNDRFIVKNNKQLTLKVSFSGEDMGGGYEYHTPDEVLNYVMNGARFVMPNGTLAQTMLVNPSTMEYHGKYFHFSNGTIAQAFEKFDKEWKDNSANAFYSMWGEYVNKWS